MTQLYNTLFVTEPDISLHLEGQSIRAVHRNGEVDHIPLKRVEKIIVFSHMPISRSLMAYCAKEGIGLSAMSERGRFLFRIEGPTRGSIQLRKRQFSLTEAEKLALAKTMLKQKLENERQLLTEHIRNHDELNSAQLLKTDRTLCSALERTIRKDEDSIRLYRLGNRYGGRTETLGAETAGWDRESFVL